MLLAQDGNKLVRFANFFAFCVSKVNVPFLTWFKYYQWERISYKQSARWQHLSQLKATALFSSQKLFLVVKKCNILHLGLVMPSRG
jgi:hypothetical protein